MERLLKFTRRGLAVGTVGPLMDYVLCIERWDYLSLFQQVGAEAAGALHGLIEFPFADLGLVAAQ